MGHHFLLQELLSWCPARALPGSWLGGGRPWFSLSFPSAAAVPLGSRCGHLGELCLGHSRVGVGARTGAQILQWIAISSSRCPPFSSQGLNPHLLHWPRGFFATELPGKPPQPYLRVYHLRRKQLCVIYSISRKHIWRPSSPAVSPILVLDCPTYKQKAYQSTDHLSRSTQAPVWKLL